MNYITLLNIETVSVGEVQCIEHLYIYIHREESIRSNSERTGGRVHGFVGHFFGPISGGVDGTRFLMGSDFGERGHEKIDGTRFFTLPWGVGWVCAQN